MTRKQLLYFFFFLYFALLPIYTALSGSLQLSDAIIPVLFIAGFRLKNTYSLMCYSTIAMMVVFYLIINILLISIHFIINASDQSLTLIFQYIYALIEYMVVASVFFEVFNHDSPENISKFIFRVLFIAQIAPFLFWMFPSHIYAEARSVLSFNNPNQLALFSLVISIMCYMNVCFSREHRIKINKPICSIIFLSVLFETFLAASRAGMPVILIDCAILMHGILPESISRKKNLLVRILLAFFFVVSAYIASNKLISYMALYRSGDLTTEQTSSDFYIRAIEGIDYLFETPMRLLFGSGLITNPWRPDSLEFHNIFTEIFNQTGLVGLTLLTMLIAMIMKKLYKRDRLIFFSFSIFIFSSLFQYSLRSRLSWILIAYVTVYLQFRCSFYYSNIAAKNNASNNSFSLGSCQ